MKHIVKILSILVAIAAFWIGLLYNSVVPQSQTWLLPVYLIISLGCYGLLMVGIGLMRFPTCPQEAALLQQSFKMSENNKRFIPFFSEKLDIIEAKDFLRKNGVDIGSD